MLLHLIRHAHAVAAEENPARPLSAHGRDQCACLGTFLRNAPASVFAPEEFWHSPLVRSRETAELLCAALAPHTTWREVAGLLPEDAPDALAARLSALAPATTLAVVGHEPQLSALATWLVCGRAEPIAFEFKKAAVLTLACETTPALGAFFACWHLPPELLPG